jgi:sulfatase maturation enzyme AslB (radical SAM superfamily)
VLRSLDPASSAMLLGSWAEGEGMASFQPLARGDGNPKQERTTDFLTRWAHFSCPLVCPYCISAHKRYFGIVAFVREPLLLHAITVREGAIRGFVQ